MAIRDFNLTGDAAPVMVPNGQFLFSLQLRATNYCYLSILAQSMTATKETAAVVLPPRSLTSVSLNRGERAWLWSTEDAGVVLVDGNQVQISMIDG